MKIDNKKLENAIVELTVAFDVDEWKETQKKALNKLAKKVKIDGFRPGKAPVAMVKARVSKGSILEEATDMILQANFVKILILLYQHPYQLIVLQIQEQMNHYQSLMDNFHLFHEALLKEEQEMLLKEIEQNLQRQGLNFEVYEQFTGKNKDAIKEDVKPQAEKRVKINAILAAIIEEEKLVVSDEELETELQTIADYYKKELAEVKKIFEGNMSRIENDLLTRKAIELVKDNLKK